MIMSIILVLVAFRLFFLLGKCVKNKFTSFLALASRSLRLEVLLNSTFPTVKGLFLARKTVSMLGVVFTLDYIQVDELKD